jgi:DDE family transposase
MDDPTPYLPQLRGRCAPMGASTRRARTATKSLTALAVLFEGFFPGLLVPAGKGAGSRRRQLPRSEVFWAFLGQVLLRGASCRWALSRLQAAAVAGGRPRPGDSTSAYCQARGALSLPWLQSLFAALGRWFEPRTHDSWCARTVRIIDGTGFSMPDTSANRKRWPYPGGQKPGCGFPAGKLVGLFCLHSGRLIAFGIDLWKAHDLALARRLLKALRPGEVLLADRAYCGWHFLVLLRRRKVDFVIRLHQARRVNSRTLRSWWESWEKGQRPPSQSRPSWERLPAELLVRLICFRIQARGFRTKTVIVATSLLDQAAFPDSAIAELYLHRWQIELNYRQIKTNLSLDVLRGLSPAIVERELWMHALAYNLVRALMLEAALTYHVPLDRLSFKGSLDALHAWAPGPSSSQRFQRCAHSALIARIAADFVPLRPGRHEPRARKRRPKSYNLLTRPRHLMRIADSRHLR